MILGEFRHTLDAKNRTFLPAKLRDALGENIVIARGIDKCITVYPMESWKKFEASIEQLPPIKARQVRRWIYGFALDTTVDSQGRVVIPPAFKQYADLSKNIVSLGVGDHIEIWSEDAYEAMVGSMKAEDIEETLIEMGM